MSNNMKTALLLVLFFLATCGFSSCGDVGSSSVTASQAQDNSQQQDSQNGEAECTFQCEPVELAGVAGFAVTQLCSGVIQNGPNFFEAPPVGCEFIAVEEDEEEPVFDSGV